MFRGAILLHLGCNEGQFVVQLLFHGIQSSLSMLTSDIDKAFHSAHPPSSNAKLTCSIEKDCSMGQSSIEQAGVLLFFFLK